MADIKLYGTLIRDDSTNEQKIVRAPQVEGGYFVCSTLPSWGELGQLCYCTNDLKFYQYSGDNKWEVASFSDMSNYLTCSGGNMSGHIYLTGAVENSSTSNKSQIVFGTEANNHVAISSNAKALIINPNTSETVNQIVLYLEQQSAFPKGISGGPIESTSLTQNGTAVSLEGHTHDEYLNKNLVQEQSIAGVVDAAGFKGNSFSLKTHGTDGPCIVSNSSGTAMLYGKDAATATSEIATKDDISNLMSISGTTLIINI